MGNNAENGYGPFSVRAWAPEAPQGYGMVRK